jgi:hypothetical protein
MIALLALRNTFSFLTSTLSEAQYLSQSHNASELKRRLAALEQGKRAAS